MLGMVSGQHLWHTGIGRLHSFAHCSWHCSEILFCIRRLILTHTKLAITNTVTAWKGSIQNSKFQVRILVCPFGIAILTFVAMVCRMASRVEGVGVKLSSKSTSLPVTRQRWRSHHSIRNRRKPPVIRIFHGSVFYSTGVFADWSFTLPLYNSSAQPRGV